VKVWFALVTASSKVTPNGKDCCSIAVIRDMLNDFMENST
jgi:hypothetical protein